MPAADEKKAFKDWFDADAVRLLGEQIVAVYPDFAQSSFRRRATRGLLELEMMDRVRQISNALRAHLPQDTRRALEVITASLPAPLPDCEAVTDGWLQWPVGQLIADHGVEHFEASMSAMHALTQRFSSEFAVRPFIERYPDESFERLLSYADDPSPHVRRWCSEGVRPRLPWGMRLRGLIADPTPIFPILERLKDDPELYVRRSVANTLNDITKDHPERVIALCRRWHRSRSAQRRWIVNHALRSLLKAGHPGALGVLGYNEPSGIDATLSVKPARAKIGSAVSLALRLSSPRAQPLLVDYAVHYVLANGRSGRKVFKWKTLDLEGEVTLEKRHPLKRTTTRTLRPGRHRVEVQINGVVVAESAFELGA